MRCHRLSAVTEATHKARLVAKLKKPLNRPRLLRDCRNEYKGIQCINFTPNEGALICPLATFYDLQKLSNKIPLVAKLETQASIRTKMTHSQQAQWDLLIFSLIKRTF